MRAKMVLMADEGPGNDKITARLDTAARSSSHGWHMTARAGDQACWRLARISVNSRMGILIAQPMLSP